VKGITVSIHARRIRADINDMRRMLTPVLALLLMLVAASAAQAWVRKESDRWVWYVPNSHWVDSQSDNGIDISSPTGILYVGHGFSATPMPVTHEWVVDYTKRSGSLDQHPLRSIRFGRPGRVVTQGTVARRVYRWKGYRKDRHERVRGVMTVDVINDPSTLTYGFDVYQRVAPASLYRRWNGKLAFIQRHILLHPRTPDFSNAF
jgi:hypothetical protein